MLRTKKKWVTDYKMSLSLLEDTEVLFEFFKEGEGTQQKDSIGLKEAISADAYHT